MLFHNVLQFPAQILSSTWESDIKLAWRSRGLCIANRQPSYAFATEDDALLTSGRSNSRTKQRHLCGRASLSQPVTNIPPSSRHFPQPATTSLALATWGCPCENYLECHPSTPPTPPTWLQSSRTQLTTHATPINQTQIRI